jgi:hypothetical protein
MTLEPVRNGTLLEEAFAAAISPTADWLHRARKRDANIARHFKSAMPKVEFNFRCECARPDCPVRLQLDVCRHRGRLSRYIVGIGHDHGETVVGVADHFFIVEP